MAYLFSILIRVKLRFPSTVLTRSKDMRSGKLEILKLTLCVFNRQIALQCIGRSGYVV